MQIKCKTCNKLFYRRPSHVHKNNFCSNICKGKFKTQSGYITLICKVCSKKFKRVKSWMHKAKGLFCSRKCSGKHNQGQNNYAFINGLPKCLDCNKLLTNYDSIRCKKCTTKYFKGKNHWLYKLGLSSKEILQRVRSKGLKWRYQIFGLYNFTCVKCGQRGGKLVAHHLEGYHWCIELRFELSNGVCLCRKCHKNFHNRYGTRWNTTEQFINFKGEL